MPRLTRIYTRSGDDGTTGLGGGQRVPKDAARIEAYGTVDELNSALGLALAGGLDPVIAGPLTRIQHELFNAGTDLCFLPEDQVKFPGPRLEARHVTALEELMDQLTGHLGPLENFILPGGTPGASALHLARTICRRAERRVVALHRLEPVGEQVPVYLNRLSDLLFVMARWENHARGVSDVYWDSRKT